METSENNLEISKNFESSDNINKEINAQLSTYFKNRSQTFSESNNKRKIEQDILHLIETSTIELTNLDLSNEIITGIKDFEFEAGIEKLNLINSERYNFKLLRKRSHIQISIACAHAAYFVGIVNRIRRNIEDIKNGITKHKNSMLLNEMKKAPGLQIGIIGCGRLGRQLAKAFLEYSEVYPNELHISTRQPDLLNEFISKNVKCYFDNRKLVNSVNIVFICVLPSQLQMVVNEIKKSLPDKCIIYSLVRPVNGLYLRNLLNDSISRSFILRPEYEFTEKLNDLNFKWNYSLDIIESLSLNDTIEVINPFNDDEDSLIRVDNKLRAAFVYSIINICSFLNLEKNHTLTALKGYVFYQINKNFKLEETNFYENKNQSSYLPIVDLVDSAHHPTSLSAKLENSKSYRKALSKNFSKFFEEANNWRIRHSIKS